MYIFPFSHFVSVYVYASLSDFICIALLLPFVLVFRTCYHWRTCFLIWLLSGCVADKVLVLQMGVRPVSLRWES